MSSNARKKNKIDCGFIFKMPQKTNKAIRCLQTNQKKKKVS